MSIQFAPYCLHSIYLRIRPFSSVIGIQLESIARLQKLSDIMRVEINRTYHQIQHMAPAIFVQDVVSDSTLFLQHLLLSTEMFSRLNLSTRFNRVRAVDRSIHFVI